ncbi:glutamate racemase [Wukongibacter baidiensis]|uniref:glutamate racemase n=1 Tax=Wukongibacter baidiensis TaxID=1723361 RepID=UPI003D7F1C3E
MVDNKNLAIGIFDSGMGGISVLAQAIKLMPNEKYIYYGDSENAPYGIKSPEEVKELCIDICDFFIEMGVKAIVVACNTATSAAINDLRGRYDIPIIGMEPALKPATTLESKGKIVVMATDMTLKEKKFSALMNKYGKEKDIVRLPCPKLVELIESGIMEGETIKDSIKECFDGISIDQVSSIVLGCTHYIFLKDSIREFVGAKVQIIDGNEGTARHLKNVLEKKKLLNNIDEEEVQLNIYNSKEDKEIIELSKKLLTFSLEKLEF